MMALHPAEKQSSKYTTCRGIQPTQRLDCFISSLQMADAKTSRHMHCYGRHLISGMLQAIVCSATHTCSSGCAAKSAKYRPIWSRYSSRRAFECFPPPWDSSENERRKAKRASRDARSDATAATLAGGELAARDVSAALRALPDDRVRPGPGAACSSMSAHLSRMWQHDQACGQGLCCCAGTARQRCTPSTRCNLQQEALSRKCGTGGIARARQIDICSPAACSRMVPAGSNAVQLATTVRQVQWRRPMQCSGRCQMQGCDPRLAAACSSMVGSPTALTAATSTVRLPLGLRQTRGCSPGHMQPAYDS